MREALARTDHDFVLSERRPTKSRQRRTGAHSKLLHVLSLAYRLAGYPNRIAGALLAGLLIAIIVNALVLQQGRHPAPLFGRSFDKPMAVAHPAPASAPQAKAGAERPSPTPPTAAAFDPIQDHLTSETSPAPRADQARAEKSTASQPSQDPISQLLKSDAAPEAAGKEKPNKTVLAAQRALLKLGFVVKPDGLEGNATRQAIEQYERDRHLPADGQLSAKIKRQLSAESRITIE